MDDNFLNCYITDGASITVRIKDVGYLKEEVLSSPYLISTIPLEDGTSLVVFQIPDEHLGDIIMLQLGKYSRISDKAKNKIKRLRKLASDDWLIEVITRSEKRRLRMMEALDVHIEPTAELKDPPSASNFTTIANLMSEYATTDAN